MKNLVIVACAGAASALSAGSSWLAPDVIEASLTVAQETHQWHPQDVHQMTTGLAAPQASWELLFNAAARH